MIGLLSLIPQRQLEDDDDHQRRENSEENHGRKTTLKIDEDSVDSFAWRTVQKTSNIEDAFRVFLMFQWRALSM